jgi:N-acetylglucosamine-6-sulfatase
VKRLPRPIVAGSIALAALAVPVFATVAASAQTPSVAAPARPNILLVVTDDQRWDTLDAMPIVQRELVARGVTFTDAFVSNPLCCPSRASILTGNYSHTTGVYRQITPFGAFPSFRDSSTLATWLDDAGYATGLFGKYIDAYQHDALIGYVPPGWDRWFAFVHSGYYNYGVTVDGVADFHGADPVADYSTSVLGEAAERFLRDTPAGQPVFVEFAPAAPHEPAIGEPRFDAMFRGMDAHRPPSYDEADVSDKPAYIRALPPLSGRWMNWIDGFRQQQYRTLQSVDEQVGRLLDTLEETGRLEDTVVVFTSDNGLSWGEHRWKKKEVPYDEALRVPMVVRYDRMMAGPRTDDALVLNVDIAPTIAGLARVDHPPTDGSSLEPLLADPSAPWRSDFLIEHMEGANPVPSYCGVRTRTQKYVRYETGERELYDLASDPFEMVNVVDEPARSAEVATLATRLDELCDPPPPGMDAGATGPVAIAFVGLSGAIGALGWRSSRRRRPVREELVPRSTDEQDRSGGDLGIE